MVRLIISHIAVEVKVIQDKTAPAAEILCDDAAVLEIVLDDRLAVIIFGAVVLKIGIQQAAQLPLEHLFQFFLVKIGILLEHISEGPFQSLPILHVYRDSRFSREVNRSRAVIPGSASRPVQGKVLLLKEGMEAGKGELFSLGSAGISVESLIDSGDGPCSVLFETAEDLNPVCQILPCGIL